MGVGATAAVPDGPLGIHVPRRKAPNLAPKLILPTDRTHPALLTKSTFLAPPAPH